MQTGCGLLGIILHCLTPRFILRAWVLTGEKLAEISSPPSDTRPPEKPAAAATVANTVPSMYQPPDHLDTLANTPRQKPAAECNILKRLHEHAGNPGGEVYLSLIQDFMKIHNTDGAYRALGMYKDSDKALKRLMKAGQRHPGMVVKVRACSVHVPARSDFNGLDTCRAAPRDLVVLSLLPAGRDHGRFCISAAIDAFSENTRERADAVLDRQPVFSVLACICVIDDSEHGPYAALQKDPEAPIIRGIM